MCLVAPYVHSNQSDWWYHKLCTNRRLFWQAHCRSAHFCDTLKDLIEQMLCIDPVQRITVEEIMQHAWWQEVQAQPAQ